MFSDLNNFSNIVSQNNNNVHTISSNYSSLSLSSSNPSPANEVLPTIVKYIVYLNSSLSLTASGLNFIQINLNNCKAANNQLLPIHRKTGNRTSPLSRITTKPKILLQVYLSDGHSTNPKTKQLR